MIKKLPIDVSTLSVMLSEDYLYVDKTKIIHGLITQGRHYFLSRPRRFGKSLFISTLKEIFSGNKELFKELWIYTSDYTWPKHPIIHLDFSALDIESAEELKISLNWTLESIAQKHDITLESAPSPGTKLKALIEKLSEKNSVVILIDEYDFPLINNLDNPKIAAANRKVLKSFYSSLKSMDEFLKAIYVTGVTKSSKTSLFSGLNNLNDITIDPRAAALCGYTHAEIETYFTDYIARFALATNRKADAIKSEMEAWYDGYQFSNNPTKVFNPFSVLYYFVKQKKSNYWLESGTPGFLIGLLRNQASFLEDIEKAKFSEKSLGTFDLEQVPIIPVLFQAGYLTIKSYDPEREEYQLQFPNAEIRESFKTYVLVAISQTDIPTVERITSLLSHALMNNDIKLFCSHLESLLANIPYQLHITEERYYHSLFQLIGSMLGLDVQSEVSTDKGRIDLVLSTKTHCYIFECKLNASAAVAPKQIEERKYYEKYLNQSKKIVLGGLSFAKEKNKFGLETAIKEMNPLVPLSL